MLTTILGFLTAIAPLIISAGTALINMFISDQQQQAAATTAFLQAIQQHVNDALASVNEHTNYNQQVSELQADAAAADKAKTQPPASNS